MRDLFFSNYNKKKKVWGMLLSVSYSGYYCIY